MASEALNSGVTMAFIPPACDTVNGSGRSTDGAHHLTEIHKEYVKVFGASGLAVFEKNVSDDGHVSWQSAGPDDSGLTIAHAGPEREGRLWELIEEGHHILVGPEKPDRVVEELADALRDGRLSADKVEEALARIEAARGNVTDPAPGGVDYEANERLSREISGRAVTIVQGGGKFFPVRDSDSLPLIYAGDEAYFRTSPLRFYVKQASHANDPIPSKERPSVFLLFDDGESTDDDTERLARLIRSSSPAMVVSFGDPSMLARFREAKILIAAYDGGAAAQEAVFECITGERHFEGHLPAPVPGLKVR